MTHLLAAFVVFVLVMAGMALGVIFSDRTIKGSCGGLNALGGDSGEPGCACGGEPYACVMISGKAPGSVPKRAKAGQSELMAVG